MEAIFAATPPLDTLRAVVAKAAERRNARGQSLFLQLIDISRAHFYAEAVRDVYIQLPRGDPRHGEADLCGKLRRTMYGTLDAAEQWAIHYTSVLTRAGFRQGVSSPCHFWHEARDLWVLVHGDDFLSVGASQDQFWLENTLKAVYELKCSQAGPDPNLVRNFVCWVASSLMEKMELVWRPMHSTWMSLLLN